jgi:sulfate/thiosulfate transport system substrate-binding protein
VRCATRLARSPTTATRGGGVFAPAAPAWPGGDFASDRLAWRPRLLRFSGAGGLGVALVLLALSAAPLRAGTFDLLNVSYDPTRELYRALNDAFAKSYAAKTGDEVAIHQSHGGSGTQARAVIDGLEADVVTLALYGDTDAIRKAGLIEGDWVKRLPNDSLPYTSTIVFVVRKGNPKAIKDWPDLVKAGVQIVTPNPKTSGNGKLSFLSAWGSVKVRGGSDEDALEFVKKLYAQVPVLDLGARGSTTTFVQKGVGDVHLTWENEAYLEADEAKGAVEIVYPSTSILAEPYVAWVDANVKHKGTEKVARAYLEFLYTPEAQEIIAKNYYRPTNADVLAKHHDQFPAVKLFPVTTVAAGWDDAQQKFFADGAIFDGFYKAK